MPYPIQVLSVCNAYTLFFFLMGGKMCAHTVQLYLVAFHMGLM